jgi:hypothetical protein
MPEYLYTKDQTLKVFSAWGVKESLPKKSQKTLIAFPPGADFRVGTVTVHDQKSTYGKTLYKIVLSNEPQLQTPGLPGAGVLGIWG